MSSAGMSGALPQMPYRGGVRRLALAQFGGYEHRETGPDGYIYDMGNLTSDHWPVLASRQERIAVRRLGKPNGLYCTDKLFLVDGTALLVDGSTVGQVTDGPKQMCAISGRVTIWPDKAVYTREGKLEQLGARYTAAGLVFSDGTYAGQSAKANTIKTAGAAFPFRVGDAVTITGCTVKAANNKTPIVREVSEDGKQLRFYENTFDLGGTGAVTEPGQVGLERAVPDLDFVCANENRLWGCKGDTIYASKLGDPYNWNVFDGIGTDAWSVDSGTPGAFTGCCSFLGYPIFFKEDKVFKVYGDRPTNFQLMSSATLGVSAGSGRSLAVAGETLYYLSRAGIVAYSGGMPRCISQPLGEGRYKNAVAGSNGLKYYVSMEDTDGAWTLFVYDSQRELWHKEDGTRLMAAGYLHGLYALTAQGQVMVLDRGDRDPAGGTAEGALDSWVEFGDIGLGDMGSKYPVRLWLRLAARTGTHISTEIRHDAGPWLPGETVAAGEMEDFYLSLPVKRCRRFRLRLRADGPWRLYGMELETSSSDYVRK